MAQPATAPEIPCYSGVITPAALRALLGISLRGLIRPSRMTLLLLLIALPIGLTLAARYLSAGEPERLARQFRERKLLEFERGPSFQEVKLRGGRREPIDREEMERILDKSAALGREKGLENTARALSDTEFAVGMVMLPNFLAPLVMLLLAAGIIQDEQEDQTLTYLLIRPVPRWAVYLIKLLAVLLVGVLLSVWSCIIVFVLLWWGLELPDAAGWERRCLSVCLAMTLTASTYAALFGLISLLIKRMMVVGTIYLTLIEGVMANFIPGLRQFSITYYFQALIVQDLELGMRQWNIEKKLAPDWTESVVTLLTVALLTTATSCYLFTTREYRVKTPEGN